MKIPSVTEGVHNYIRTRIITGELKPQQRLSEVELSSMLGISRPPLREAFRLLQKEHLVHTTPRKGTCVTSLSRSDFLEVFQVREMMETYAIQLLERHNIREVPEVISALTKPADLTPPPESDPEARYEFLKAIAGFHIKLVESAGNFRLSSLYHALLPSLARYQSLYTYDPGLMKDSNVEHHHIVGAIKAGEYGQARDILRTHIRSFVDIKINKLDDAIVSANRVS